MVILVHFRAYPASHSSRGIGDDSWYKICQLHTSPNYPIPNMTVPARSQPYVLSPEQVQAYNEQGYIVIDDFYTPEEHETLVQYCTDLQNWGEAKGKWMQYYEKNTRTGEKQLCRTENFTPFHDGMREYVRSQRLMDVLKELHGEEYILFKEKVNYKLPGGGGESGLTVLCIGGSL